MRPASDVVRRHGLDPQPCKTESCYDRLLDPPDTNASNQTCHNDMMYMSRMKTYRVLNATPLFIDTGPAPHLRVALTRKQRSVLSKLRSGTLPLAIETRRYRQTPLPQRLCTRCDAQVVEDEEHFLFHCPQYHQLRQTICEGLLADNVDMKSLFDSDTAIKNFPDIFLIALNWGATEW